MTKRLLLLLLALLMIVPALAHAEETGNLLVNGGFELLDADGLPSGWYTDAYINREGVSLYSMTEDAHTGEKAAVVENIGMNDARFAQQVDVEPNSLYKLSGWIRADAIADSGRGANLSVSDIYVFSDSVFDSEGNWVYVEMYGQTGPDQHQVTVFARVGGYSGESIGRAAFDDLSLEKVDKLPSGVKSERWYKQETVEVIEVEDEDASSGELQPFWPWLIVLSAVYAGAGLWLMRWFQLDRREEALREAASDKRKAGMPVFAMVGLLIAAVARILVALNVEGYEVDVNCFSAWGATMSNVGASMFYQSNWCDYTPGYIYVMGFNGSLANVLGRYVSVAFVHKLIPMACDLIGAWLVYRLAAERRYSRHQAGLLALLVAFNPAIFINSAAWCQIDSVLCLGLMLVAYFAIHRRWALVLPTYVLCALVKPQALMLGFLGLAAIIMEIVICPREHRSKLWRDMGIGLLASAVVAAIIILPFCPNQTSGTWLFELYGDTLASYPHATVNTANLYYLFGANWDAITNEADTVACVFFAAVSAAWAAYTFLRRGEKQLSLLEPVLMAAYAAVYLVMAVIGVTWTTLGVAAMSMAFVVILPMYIRGGKLENLPLCGAVIFLMLYVLGIKMHERYLFPAIFLLAMAYAIRRDRRILGILIGASCTLFINEGVILDNALRLGKSMGHLNNDTLTLANILSVLNVGFTLLSVWLCQRICVEDCEVRYADTVGAPVLPVREHAEAPCTPLSFKGESKVRWTRLDALLITVVTAIYAVVTLSTLGSTKAPQNPWKSTTYDEQVVIDLGQYYEDFSMLYFCQVSYDDFSIAVSDEGEVWSEEHWAQMAEGQCFRWKYLVPRLKNADGSYLRDTNGNISYKSASTFEGVEKLSGRYVRVSPHQVGLIINELIFKDAEGNIIPANIVGATGYNEASPLYSLPENLLDEQDTLEGEPGWWNSTYFDEIYHARTGFEHLNGTVPYETSHPPLGKVIMSWCIAIFGMTPFGWRFAGALCGILMLPAMYLLGKQLTRRTDMAFAAMMLMALDCMHFTQTRIATIDSFPVLFIILSYFFMLRFMQRDIVLEDVKKLLPDLALSGFFMGCGVASKWIGVYAGVGLAILYFWTCFRHLRMGMEAARIQRESEVLPEETRSLLERRDLPAMKRILTLCLWCLLFFVAVPVAIYLLSYVPYFAYLDLDSLSEFIARVIRAQEGMLSYHSTPGLGMDHPFYSPWYEWPLMQRPMYYASPSFVPEGWSYAIFCFGNPAVWFVGLAGIAYAVYRWVQQHRYVITGKEGTFQLYADTWDVAPAFILIGLLAQFLPWVLVPRGTYIYHYFASVPFLILGTVLLLKRLNERWPKAGRIVLCAYLAVSLLLFILLFPYASGVMTPTWWMDMISDYPWLAQYTWSGEHPVLERLNDLLQRIPLFPHVYY